MIPLSRSPIGSSVILLMGHIFLLVLCLYGYLALREDMRDFHADISSVLVEGYTKYYEKWPDKRLEGAHQFLKMSSEPTVEMVILNQAFLIVLVLIAVNATSSIYYEFRMASLRRKLDSLQDGS